MELKKTINKELVVAYFGLKAKRNNASLTNFSRKEIFAKSLDVLPQKAIFQAVEAINAKYGTKFNAKSLYNIRKGVLISEIGSIFEEYPRLHKRQIIRLFENMASAKKDTLVSSTAVPAPLTVDLIDWLSDYTHRELRYASIERAIDDGEAITVNDLADFFSERKGRKIAEILARISRPGISRETVKSFIADSCGKKAEDIDENELITTLAPSLGSCGKDDYYVVILWAEDEFNKTVSNHFAEHKTIGELITLLAQ